MYLLQNSLDEFRPLRCVQRALLQGEPATAYNPLSWPVECTRLTLVGRTLLPRGVRTAQAQGKITPARLASWRQMSKSPSRRFPVTVTQLPVTRCEICQRTVAYRPGRLSEVLTEHYRRAHPEVLGVPLQ